MPVEMSHRPNARKGLLFAGLSTLLMLTGCSGQDGEGQQAGAGGMPPAAVVVQQATLADVTVRQDYAGRARGAREVEVRARISGILEQRLYEEGQMVREGDALFRIDRKPAAAALQRARAQRQVAEADVQQAEREWNRISSLFERNAVSERERDSAQSALELARANLAVANAGVAQAELDLGYTDVTAPISGVTSTPAIRDPMTPTTTLRMMPCCASVRMTMLASQPSSPPTTSTSMSVIIIVSKF